MDGLYGPIYIRCVNPTKIISSKRLNIDCPRPRQMDASLVNTISNDSADRTKIQKAIQDPKLLVLSDWFHNTSEELLDIAVTANLDTM